MKIITSVAVFAMLAAGCEQQPSRLDKVTSKEKVAERAPGATNPSPGKDAPAALKIDRSGSVDQQLARLQDAYDRNAEAMDFLNKVHSQQKAQQQQQQQQEPAEDAVFAVNMSGDIKLGQVDGPANAIVTVIKAFDFACPYCLRANATMEELVKENNGKVRVVYSNLVVHENARPAHLASCAAAKQGKYKEFKNAFWEKGFKPYAQSRNPASLEEPNLLAIAKEVGLDTGKLKTDMSGQECAALLAADQEELQKFRVNSTPTFFINGKHVGGALPKAAFQQIIDEQIKIAEASGVPAGDYYEKVVLGKGESKFRSKVDPKPN